MTGLVAGGRYDPDQRHARPLFPVRAVLASLCLHGLVFVGLVRVHVQPADNPPPVPPQSLVITLEPRAPALTATAFVPEAAETPDPGPALQAGETGPAMPTHTPEPPVTAPALPADPAPAVAMAGDDEARTVAVDIDTTTPILDAGDVQLALDRYMAGYRRQQSRQWLEQCLLYRQKHGTQTCPQQENGHSASAVGPESLPLVQRDRARAERHSRLALDLDRQNARLRTLMFDESVLGELARDRFAMNRGMISYLGDNLNQSARRYVMASQAGNPNMPFLLDNMLQFICAEGDCIYEYSPFRVERPVGHDDGRGMVPLLDKRSLFPVAVDASPAADNPLPASSTPAAPAE